MTSDFYKRPLFLILTIYALILFLFLPVPSAKKGDASFLVAPRAQEMVIKADSYPSVRKDKQVFTAKILSVNGKETKGRTYVYCKTCPEMSKGEILTVIGVLGEVRSEDNYGSFNWKNYLARRHIFSQIDVREVKDVQRASLFWRVISAIRADMLKVFTENFDANLSAILSGIAIGEKGDLDKGLYAAFQDSGAIHLLVASGGNVGFVTLMVYFLCSLFLTGRFAPAAAALTTALFYTLIAGADAPLIRAYIMTFAATAGLLLGRRSGVLQGFIIAAFLILIFNPQSIFDVGFQMSFLATLAIVYFVCNFNFTASLPKTAAWAAELFFISLSAQLALVPIFTNCFHKISFAAVLSNIFLVPLSGLIMGGAFLLWFISFWHISFVFKTVVLLLKILLAIFNFLVEAFANTPLAGITASSWKTGYVLAYYTALFAVFNFALFKNKKRFLALYGALCMLFLLYAFFTKGGVNSVLKGRYNYSLFVKENGKVIVVGAGVSPKTLKSAVLSAGSKEIDCIFISSRYKSALYALTDIEGIKIKKLYLPQGEIPSAAAEILARIDADVYPIVVGEEYCGVSVERAWYYAKSGEKYIPAKSGNLSFRFKGYDFAGNMKAYRHEDTITIFGN